MNWFKSFWKSASPSKEASASDEPLVNFTPRAQQVLALARKEADRFNYNFVGTEHLLLGLIRLGQGIAVNALKNIGLDLETIRKEVEIVIGTGPDEKIISNIPYTPRVKKVLALARKECLALNHTYLGTEHILLGLLAEGDGVGARVLKNLGVKIEKVRQEILKELAPHKNGFDGWRFPAADKAKAPSSHIAKQMDAEPLFRGNFTPRAQQVLVLAREEARRLNHNFVGTEHLLLGHIKLGQGVAANVLLKMGLNLETVRMEVEKQIGIGTDTNIPHNIPYAPQVKQVLVTASKEAKALGHTYVGTEHLLLGLLHEESGVAARVLKNLNVNAAQVRKEILKDLDPNFGANDNNFPS